MIGVRLHGPCDLRVENLPEPPPPRPGEALVRVTAAGICGSDLHTYTHARIGDTAVATPLVLGHEFSGIVEECGALATDGNGQRLMPGRQVAVDPASPCGMCAMCRRGDQHLCTALRFCGLYPDDGCFRQRLIVPSRSCFPLPDSINDSAGALLEPLGVAMHAMEIAGIQQGATVSLFGAGPIGLLMVQLARLKGAAAVFVIEPLDWRRALAERFGGIPIPASAVNPVADVLERTEGRGVDIAIESAWAESTIQQAAETTAPGGRVVLVGIPADDRLSMSHSTGRRKELTLLFSRRMKHTYPAAISLVQDTKVDVQSLISHRFPLSELPGAFALNAAYRDGVVKVIIDAKEKQ
jgi:L-iditol 2-dehydrogenase